MATSDKTVSGSPDVSVVLSTYNRADVLPRALTGLLRQEAPTTRYEIVVVDNNSTDTTRAVVESFMAQGCTRLRYVFEPTQGVSYGRNRGIRESTAPFVAFTDDDVTVAPDWVEVINRVFDAHPEVDCVGGRVLPRWKDAAPSWLTHEHWAPLALLDYGETPFLVNPSRSLCLIAANMAFRRSVFDRIGLLSPQSQTLKRVVGTEDHEILLRLWRAGGQGLYAPSLLATSDIASDRLTKAYHRRWHGRHGRSMARMRAESFEATRIGRVLGAPAWVVREALEGSVRCLGCLMRGDRDRAFFHESRVRFSLGFLAARWGELLPAATSIAKRNA